LWVLCRALLWPGERKTKRTRWAIARCRENPLVEGLFIARSDETFLALGIKKPRYRVHPDKNAARGRLGRETREIPSGGPQKNHAGAVTCCALFPCAGGHSHRQTKPGTKRNTVESPTFSQRLGLLLGPAVTFLLSSASGGVLVLGSARGLLGAGLLVFLCCLCVLRLSRKGTNCYHQKQEMR
jgi:hypothetical protein